MSWSSLANNQTISFTNLKDAVDTGVLSQKFPIPISNQQINKAIANAYVNIDTSYPPYAAKANNQLVVKSDLISNINFTLTTNLSWNGIANNQTTSNPIQLISGYNNNYDGRIFRSTDFGLTYSSVLIISDLLFRIKFASNFRHASYLSVPPFVAVGSNGRIVTNSVTNCSSWITISSPTTQALVDCAFNDFGTGIIVGESRILRTNTAYRINSWSIVNSLSRSWRGVATDGYNFVAVGVVDSVAYSTDLGITWTLATIPSSLGGNVFLFDVTYHIDGYFYAVGLINVGMTIIRSSNAGATWEVYSPTGDPFLDSATSVISINNRLVIGGAGGHQYQIVNNVVTRVTKFNNYPVAWYSCVKDANSNGFDMAGYARTGFDGGYSNF
jgi:hypothetical protein